MQGGEKESGMVLKYAEERVSDHRVALIEFELMNRLLPYLTAEDATTAQILEALDNDNF